MPDNAIEFVDGALKNATVTAGEADARLFTALVKPGLVEQVDVDQLSFAIASVQAAAARVQEARDAWAAAEDDFRRWAAEIERLQGALRDGLSAKVDPQPADTIPIEPGPAVTIALE